MDGLVFPNPEEALISQDFYIHSPLCVEHVLNLKIYIDVIHKKFFGRGTHVVPIDHDG